VDTKASILALRENMAKWKKDLIKWMFFFWVLNLITTFGFFWLLLK
jgi:hypothetical protein